MYKKNAFRAKKGKSCGKRKGIWLLRNVELETQRCRSCFWEPNLEILLDGLDHNPMDFIKKDYLPASEAKWKSQS